MNGLDAFHQSERVGFLSEDDVGGWRRFYSTDPRFPIAFSCPPSLWVWLDRSRPAWLKAEIEHVAVFDREDLCLAALDGDADAALVMIRPSLAPARLIRQIKRQADRQTYLGVRASTDGTVDFDVVPRGHLAGSDEPVMVFDVHPRIRPDDMAVGFVAAEGLFVLARRLGSEMERDVFVRLVDSIRWLGERARRRIDAQHRARVAIRGDGDLMRLLTKRVSRRLAALRTHPGDSIEVLGVTVSFDPADLPAKPSNWPTSGHFRVSRGEQSSTVFGSESLAAIQLIEEARRLKPPGWNVEHGLVEVLLR